MAENGKAKPEKTGDDVTAKFQSKRAALQAQLALLDEEEKAAKDAQERVGTERLIAAMSKEKFGTVSKGDATRFAKLVAKLGLQAALERLGAA